MGQRKPLYGNANRLFREKNSRILLASLIYPTHKTLPRQRPPAATLYTHSHPLLSTAPQGGFD